MKNIFGVTSIDNVITPLDGRYHSKINSLSNYFSESALNKYRIKIEIDYLVCLSNWKIVNKLTKKEISLMRRCIEEYSIQDFMRIKEIEKKTNHDIKAVEYFLREKLENCGLKKIIPFTHFGLTSEDVNNLAYGLILKDFKEQVFEKELFQLINRLKIMVREYQNISMLAKTHGQPAAGTTVGKELANYLYRLNKQLKKIKSFRFEGKCSGAVGNNNALKVALPSKNWINLTKKFIESLGLIPNLYTTQILFYDNWLEFFQIVSLINGILIDLSINIWNYIMLNIFFQKKTELEIGSSTMPQKVNPINFEQAEGSLGLANSMFQFFERKLTHSRLQRDLSDSIVRRSFAEAFGYSLLGYKNIQSGLDKLIVNEKHLIKELDEHWEILTEAVQIVLRLKNEERAYEKVKSFSRGKKMNREDYFKLLKDLRLDNDKKLNTLTPKAYVGYAEELVKLLIKTL